VEPTSLAHSPSGLSKLNLVKSIEDHPAVFFKSSNIVIGTGFHKLDTRNIPINKAAVDSKRLITRAEIDEFLRLDESERYVFGFVNSKAISGSDFLYFFEQILVREKQALLRRNSLGLVGLGHEAFTVLESLSSYKNAVDLKIFGTNLPNRDIVDYMKPKTPNENFNNLIFSRYFHRRYTGEYTAFDKAVDLHYSSINGPFIKKLEVTDSRGESTDVGLLILATPKERVESEFLAAGFSVKTTQVPFTALPEYSQIVRLVKPERDGDNNAPEVFLNGVASNFRTPIYSATGIASPDAIANRITHSALLGSHMAKAYKEKEKQKK
jgi:hypothetical protein